MNTPLTAEETPQIRDILRRRGERYVETYESGVLVKYSEKSVIVAMKEYASQELSSAREEIERLKGQAIDGQILLAESEMTVDILLEKFAAEKQKSERLLGAMNLTEMELVSLYQNMNKSNQYLISVMLGRISKVKIGLTAHEGKNTEG